jgi:hypothetical protein
MLPCARSARLENTLIVVRNQYNPTQGNIRSAFRFSLTLRYASELAAVVVFTLAYRMF